MKKPIKEQRRQIIAIKLKASELQMLLAKAVRYTDKNVSELVRRAVADYKK